MIRSNTEKVKKRLDRSGLSYLLDRLVTGERVAFEEFGYYGVTADVGPAVVLTAAADYLDDGFHDQLVADLREIVEGGSLEEREP